MYAICVARTGYVPLPLNGDDYIELLPADFRTINDYGITFENRTYDCDDLNPYRRMPSGLPGSKNRWEVHYDPYDVTVVWMRDHHREEWITVPWVYRQLIHQPFGLALWEHARQLVIQRTGPRPAEADIARTVADLLKRAGAFDLSPAEARAVAIDANRPTRSHLTAVADTPEADLDNNEVVAADGQEDAIPVSPSDLSGYEAFDPTSGEWRI